jgi:hypothetical protein
VGISSLLKGRKVHFAQDDAPEASPGQKRLVFVGFLEFGVRKSSLFMANGIRNTKPWSSFEGPQKVILRVNSWNKFAGYLCGIASSLFGLGFP